MSQKLKKCGKSAISVLLSVIMLISTLCVMSVTANAETDTDTGQTKYDTISDYQTARMCEIQNEIFGSNFSEVKSAMALNDLSVKDNNKYFNWTDSGVADEDLFTGKASEITDSYTEKYHYEDVYEDASNENKNTTVEKDVEYTVYDVYTADEFYWAVKQFLNNDGYYKINICSDLDFNGQNNILWDGKNVISTSTDKALYLEGNGYTFYNLKMYNNGYYDVNNVRKNLALFGNVQSPMVVKNLNFQSAMTLSNYYDSEATTAILFGASEASKKGGKYVYNVNINNCFCFGYGRVSTMAGATRSSSDAYYKNCSVTNSYVYGGNHVSGFVGISERPSTKAAYDVEFPECPEAYIMSVANTHPFMFKNCYSTNNEIFSCEQLMTDLDGYTSIVYGYHSGSFVSCTTGASFENCFTNNSIYSTSNTGGFVGVDFGVAKLYDKNNEKTISSYYNQCYSSGTVEGTKCIGGFIGASANSSGGSVIFNNCYSTASAGMDYAGEYLGGFVGNDSNQTEDVTVKVEGKNVTANGSFYINCYSAGEVGNTTTIVDESKATKYEKDYFLNYYNTEDSSSSSTYYPTGGFVGVLNIDNKSGDEETGTYTDYGNYGYFYNCYYDMQTSGMREMAVGLANATSARGKSDDNFNIVGITGVYTETSKEKKVAGLTDFPVTIDNQTYAMDSEGKNSSVWTYTDGYYPQLSVFMTADNSVDETSAFYIPSITHLDTNNVNEDNCYLGKESYPADSTKTKLATGSSGSNLKELDGSSVSSLTAQKLSNNTNSSTFRKMYYFDKNNPKAYDDDGNVIENATNIKFLGTGHFYFYWNISGNKPYSENISTSKSDTIERQRLYAIALAKKGTNGSGTYSYTEDDGSTTQMSLAYGYYLYDESNNNANVRYFDTYKCYMNDVIISFPNVSQYSNISIHFYSFYTYSYELNGKTYYQAAPSSTYVDAPMYINSSTYKAPYELATISISNSKAKKSNTEKLSTVYRMSQASTATVLLNHYDTVIDTNSTTGKTQKGDKETYDTVRDITSSFSFTSGENSSQKGVYYELNEEFNDAAPFNSKVSENGFDVKYTIDGKTVTGNFDGDVINIEGTTVEDKNSNQVAKYYVNEFMPGKQWVSVISTGTGSDTEYKTWLTKYAKYQKYLDSVKTYENMRDTYITVLTHKTYKDEVISNDNVIDYLTNLKSTNNSKYNKYVKIYGDLLNAYDACTGDNVVDEVSSVPELTDDTVVGSRRLRLIPTTYMEAGNDASINITEDNENVVTYSKNSSSDVNFTGLDKDYSYYNPAFTSAYIATDKIGLGVYSNYSGQEVVGYDKSKIRDDKDTANKIPNTYYAMSSAYTESADFDDTESLSVGTMQAQSLIGVSYDGAKTIIKVYKYDIDDEGNRTLVEVPLTTDSTNSGEWLPAQIDENYKKWTGEESFTADDIGYYEVEYVWAMSDGRYLTDTKNVVIDSDDTDVKISTDTTTKATLTYDANNSSGETLTEQREVGDKDSLTKNTFTTSGKIFLGWATTSTATKPEYEDNGEFTMPETDTTLYAVWGYQNAISYYTEFKYSEPWGLKFSFALLNPKTDTVINNANYDNYGMYVMAMNSEDTDTPSISEMITKGTLYSNDNSKFTKTSVKYNDTNSEYLTLTYDKDIYTQNLADDIYVLTYVTYKGRTFYGTVKNRCVIDSINSIIDTGSVGLTSYDDSQVQLAKAIKKMYSAEKKYYLSNSSNTSYPKGSNVNTSSFDTVTSDNTVSFAHSTALRAIAPWGLKLQASPTNVSNYDSYGCIVYTDTKNKFKETPTASDIISCDGAVNYSSTDNTATLEKISGKNFITAYAVGDIYTYQLASTNVYTVFYYVKDGKYYYDNVQQRNCMDMANIGIETSSGTLAGDVYSAMINLYNETYYYRNGEYPV